MKNKNIRFWLLIWGLGIAGQLCWNIENQWFNTFVYTKIDKDPSIVGWMVAVSAVVTTFATFFFGTLADRIGKRKPFVVYGYILWGILTITFGLTEFISKDMLILAAVMVISADAVMSFFGSMGNDAGYNAWSNDHMHEGNRGNIGAALAIQPVIGTIVGTLVGGALIGDNENYMLLFGVMGSFVMLIGVLAFFFMKESPQLMPYKDGTFWQQFGSVFNFKKLFKQQEMLWVNVTVAVFFIGFNVYFTHMGNYMKYYLYFTEGDLGLIQGIGLILAIVMSIPASILINNKKSPLVIYLAIAFSLVGLILISIFVRPNTVNPESVFSAPNLLLFVCVFLIGVGYITIIQSATVWSKQLYPAKTKGQYEGVRIVFFVLIPMVLGMVVATPVIKIGGEQFANALTGRQEYIPNEWIFIVGAIISVLALIPLTISRYYHNERIRQESLSQESDSEGQ